jgi:hypothetical protein
VLIELDASQHKQARDLSRTLIRIAGVQDSIAVVVAVLDHVLQHTATPDADIDAIKKHLDGLKTTATIVH